MKTAEEIAIYWACRDSCGEDTRKHTEHIEEYAKQESDRKVREFKEKLIKELSLCNDPFGVEIDSFYTVKEIQKLIEKLK